MTRVDCILFGIETLVYLIVNIYHLKYRGMARQKPRLQIINKVITMKKNKQMFEETLSIIFQIVLSKEIGR